MIGPDFPALIPPHKGRAIAYDLVGGSPLPSGERSARVQRAGSCREAFRPFGHSLMAFSPSIAPLERLTVPDGSKPLTPALPARFAPGGATLSPEGRGGDGAADSIPYAIALPTRGRDRRWGGVKRTKALLTPRRRSPGQCLYGIPVPRCRCARALLDQARQARAQRRPPGIIHE